eukprot:1976401-Rhodomonas_salina.2
MLHSFDTERPGADSRSSPTCWRSSGTWSASTSASFSVSAQPSPAELLVIATLPARVSMACAVQTSALSPAILIIRGRDCVGRRDVPSRTAGCVDHRILRQRGAGLAHYGDVEAGGGDRSSDVRQASGARPVSVVSVTGGRMAGTERDAERGWVGRLVESLLGRHRRLRGAVGLAS